jgi:malonate-semialdehyde dehydrogenase (acetylating)/methylmalonate-semialdehyde dehydrogenase
MDTGVEVGPMITSESLQRVESLVSQGLDEGAELLVDGRSTLIEGYENGYFMKPTILNKVKRNGIIHRTELFGPVLGIMYAETLDEAIEIANDAEYGNAASIFTQSGAAARKFRHDVMAGNIGINIGVAAPMAYFPFSGWKNSFFGDLHAQSRHAVEFYTQTKVVVERWHDKWTRKF